MKVLIDTNILLDIILDRDELVDTSMIAVDILDETGESYINTLTVANIHYIIKHATKNSEFADQVITKLLCSYQCADLTNSDIKNALVCDTSNFEDAIQSMIAERIKADYILTRNTKDYKKSLIPAITPEQLIHIFKNEILHI